jgi:hypothetical protein
MGKTRFTISIPSLYFSVFCKITEVRGLYGHRIMRRAVCDDQGISIKMSKIFQPVSKFTLILQALADDCQQGP